jgi:hypothetical protein
MTASHMKRPHAFVPKMYEKRRFWPKFAMLNGGNL